jgi:hypothetical protein
LVPGLPWTSPEWLAEATTWIRQRAEVVGEIEQPHVRWWSTVLRVSTTGGDLYFKAVAPLHRFEAALTGCSPSCNLAASLTSSRSMLSAAGC